MRKSKRFLTGFSTLCVFCLPGLSVSAGENIRATAGENSVLVTIDGDVFTVYRHGSEQKKPYFLPVVGPGGFETWGSEPATSENGADARKVIVTSEQAELMRADGRRESLARDTVWEAGELEADRVHIPPLDGWVSRQDVAPVSAIVTRQLSDKVQTKDRRAPDYYDHPHHKGLWLSVDEINGVRFWMESGRIVTDRVEIEQKENPVMLRIYNRWVNNEGETLLLEQSRVKLTADRLIDYDFVLIAEAPEVVIGDTKEGMLAIRMPNSMREFISGGPVTSAQGHGSANEAWGHVSEWINYVGKVDGKTLAVTIMDHAGNPWPSRYHVRDYGLFSINPFGEKSYTSRHPEPQPAREITLPRGKTLNFRYGVWIHDGQAGPDQIGKVYADFCGKAAAPHPAP